MEIGLFEAGLHVGIFYSIKYILFSLIVFFFSLLVTLVHLYSYVIHTDSISFYGHI